MRPEFPPTLPPQAATREPFAPARGEPPFAKRLRTAELETPRSGSRVPAGPASSRPDSERGEAVADERPVLGETERRAASEPTARDSKDVSGTVREGAREDSTKETAEASKRTSEAPSQRASTETDRRVGEPGARPGSLRETSQTVPAPGSDEKAKPAGKNVPPTPLEPRTASAEGANKSSSSEARATAGSVANAAPGATSVGRAAEEGRESRGEPTRWPRNVSSDASGRAPVGSEREARLVSGEEKRNPQPPAVPDRTRGELYAPAARPRLLAQVRDAGEPAPHAETESRSERRGGSATKTVATRPSAAPESSHARSDSEAESARPHDVARTRGAPVPETTTPRAESNPAILGSVADATKLAGPSRAAALQAATPAHASTSSILLHVSPGFQTQLAARAREFLERGETRLRVALDPPSLGKLTVQLEISDNKALARIVVTNTEAAALLNREREDLVRAFQSQGFDEVQVHVETESESSARGRNGEEEGDDEGETVPAPPTARSSRTSRAPTPVGSRGVDLFA